MAGMPPPETLERSSSSLILTPRRFAPCKRSHPHRFPSALPPPTPSPSRASPPWPTHTLWPSRCALSRAIAATPRCIFRPSASVRGARDATCNRGWRTGARMGILRGHPGVPGRRVGPARLRSDARLDRAFSTLSLRRRSSSTAAPAGSVACSASFSPRRASSSSMEPLALRTARRSPPISSGCGTCGGLYGWYCVGRAFRAASGGRDRAARRVRENRLWARVGGGRWGRARAALHSSASRSARRSSRGPLSRCRIASLRNPLDRELTGRRLRGRNRGPLRQARCGAAGRPACEMTRGMRSAPAGGRGGKRGGEGASVGRSVAVVRWVGRWRGRWPRRIAERAGRAGRRAGEWVDGSSPVPVFARVEEPALCGPLPRAFLVAFFILMGFSPASLPRFPQSHLASLLARMLLTSPSPLHLSLFFRAP